MTSDFVELARTAAGRYDDDERLLGIDFTIEQRLTQEGHDPVVYHVVISEGTVDVIDGSAADADVIITQDVGTAAELRTGDVHAQTAFLTGRLRVDGDVHKLLAHGELLNDLLVSGSGSDA